VNIDFEDTGKGMHKLQFKAIFKPGLPAKSAAGAWGFPFQGESLWIIIRERFL
jgi:hypothetical protein